MRLGLYSGHKVLKACRFCVCVCARIFSCRESKWAAHITKDVVQLFATEKMPTSLGRSRKHTPNWSADDHNFCYAKYWTRFDSVTRRECKSSTSAKTLPCRCPLRLMFSPTAEWQPIFQILLLKLCFVFFCIRVNMKATRWCRLSSAQFIHAEAMLEYARPVAVLPSELVWSQPKCCISAWVPHKLPCLFIWLA